MTAIYAIVVIYNRDIEETNTFVSLLKNYTKNPTAFRNFKLIIYDNSLIEQTLSLEIPFAYKYVHDQSNKGLAIAYNYALKEAIKESYDWLLLLDQDSSLSDDFIDNLSCVLADIAEDGNISAVVPKICYKNKMFSPSKVLFGGTHRPIDVRSEGVCASEVCAIGSGSAIRVSFLGNIGGFNEIFWLDCLDRWLFFTINKMRGKVYVTHSIFEHDLSIANYDEFMNEVRYLNILIAETTFMTLYKSKIENCVYYLRLIKRAVYQYFTIKDKKYSVLTLRHFVSIVLSCKLARP